MMKRDCYGEADATFELAKRERFFLVSELIQIKILLIVLEKIKIWIAKSYSKKYIKEICKFLAYENKNWLK